MIQQTNLSFLKCFLSFPSFATIMRKGRERKKWGGGCRKRNKDRRRRPRSRAFEPVGSCNSISVRIGKNLRNPWLGSWERVGKRNKILKPQWHRGKRGAVGSCCGTCTPLSLAQGLLLIASLARPTPSGSACFVRYSSVGCLMEGTSIRPHRYCSRIIGAVGLMSAFLLDATKLHSI